MTIVDIDGFFWRAEIYPQKQNRFISGRKSKETFGRRGNTKRISYGKSKATFSTNLINLAISSWIVFLLKCEMKYLTRETKILES